MDDFKNLAEKYDSMSGYEWTRELSRVFAGKHRSTIIIFENIAIRLSKSKGNDRADPTIETLLRLAESTFDDLEIFKTLRYLSKDTLDICIRAFKTLYEILAEELGYGDHEYYAIYDQTDTCSSVLAILESVDRTELRRLLTRFYEVRGFAADEINISDPDILETQIENTISEIARSSAETFLINLMSIRKKEIERILFGEI